MKALDDYARSVTPIRQSSQPVQSKGFPTLAVLGLIFITLKLTGYIGWSWWWVTAPFWAPFAVVLGFGVLFFVVAVLIGVIGNLIAKK